MEKPDYTINYVNMALAAVRRRLVEKTDHLLEESMLYKRQVERGQVPTNGSSFHQVVSDILLLQGQLETLVEVEKLQKAAGK